MVQGASLNWPLWAEATCDRRFAFFLMLITVHLHLDATLESLITVPVTVKFYHVALHLPFILLLKRGLS